MIVYKLSGGLYLSYFNLIWFVKILIWCVSVNFTYSCRLMIIQSLRGNLVPGMGWH